MAKKYAPKALQLGRTVPTPETPAKAQLDTVPNPHPDSNYLARFTAPEFTTLCSWFTGQGAWLDHKSTMLTSYLLPAPRKGRGDTHWSGATAASDARRSTHQT